jgi:hypothetical protein
MPANSDFFQALENRIALYNLLTHPFYRAWRAGELMCACGRSCRSATAGLFRTECPPGRGLVIDVHPDTRSQYQSRFSM